MPTDSPFQTDASHAVWLDCNPHRVAFLTRPLFYYCHEVTTYSEEGMVDLHYHEGCGDLLSGLSCFANIFKVKASDAAIYHIQLCETYQNNLTSITPENYPRYFSRHRKYKDIHITSQLCGLLGLKSPSKPLLPYIEFNNAPGGFLLSKLYEDRWQLFPQSNGIHGLIDMSSAYPAVVKGDRMFWTMLIKLLQESMGIPAAVIETPAIGNLYQYMQIPYKVLQPQSIWEKIALILTARFVVCTEGETAHLAAACNVPAIILFPNDLGRWQLRYKEKNLKYLTFKNELELFGHESKLHGYIRQIISTYNHRRRSWH